MSVPPLTIPHLLVLTIGIVWIYHALDLLRLNYKSEFKLESSCHCPDMWLVGVIVFFIFPISNPPFLVTKAGIFEGPSLPSFYIATPTP